MRTFTDRLLFLVDRHADGKPTVFAKKAGISGGTFHAYIKGRLPHAEQLIRIRECYDVNINWLLTGEGEIYTEKLQATDFHKKLEATNNTIDFQHMDLVRNFKDKALAKQINSNLIEIEKLSPEALKTLAAKIDGVLMGLQMSGSGQKDDDVKLVANREKK